MESNSKEMQDIIREITEVESQINVKRRLTEKMQGDVNLKAKELQRETAELERLTQCGKAMQLQLDTQKEMMQTEISREDFDSFLSSLETELFK